eukprot:9475539-Ditylum_brightwellii.AAC.1
MDVARYARQIRHRVDEDDISAHHHRDRFSPRGLPFQCSVVFAKDCFGILNVLRGDGAVGYE